MRTQPNSEMSTKSVQVVLICCVQPELCALFERPGIHWSSQRLGNRLSETEHSGGEEAGTELMREAVRTVTGKRRALPVCLGVL